MVISTEEIIAWNDYSQIEECVENVELTSIQQFYSDAHIFITGATGFMGKILLEKLLRSCPTISRVYILVRNKKGKDLLTRVNEIFEDAPFVVLKQKYPTFRNKVVGIDGDCALPGLGLSDDDKEMLTDKVNIVFHVAATVRFDEDLKKAVAINVRATKDLLKMARQMQKLQALIHVSTAYSNCVNNLIEERIYTQAVEYDKLLFLTENFSEKFLKEITPALLEDYPNTYAFTKQIGEGVVKDYCHSLPIGIVRPAIVVSTYKEPIKSWINNMYGFIGVCAGSAVGLLRVMQSDLYKNSNVVPVDMCINSIIAAAWEVHDTFKRAKEADIKYETAVYNYVSNNDQPITWEALMSANVLYGVPSIKAIWYYNLWVFKSYWLMAIVRFFVHMVPAYIVDLALFAIGKKPRMVAIYQKVHKFSEVLAYFNLGTWSFVSDNIRNLLNKMSDRDKDIFFFDLKRLDWDTFNRTCVLGIRVFLLQDPIETVEEAKIKWNRLYWADRILKAVLLAIFIRLIWALFGIFL